MEATASAAGNFVPCGTPVLCRRNAPRNRWPPWPRCGQAPHRSSGCWLHLLRGPMIPLGKTFSKYLRVSTKAAPAGRRDRIPTAVAHGWFRRAYGRKADSVIRGCWFPGYRGVHAGESSTASAERTSEAPCPQVRQTAARRKQEAMRSISAGSHQNVNSSSTSNLCPRAQHSWQNTWDN